MNPPSTCPRCLLPLADDAPTESWSIVPRWNIAVRAHVGCEQRVPKWWAFDTWAESVYGSPIDPARQELRVIKVTETDEYVAHDIEWFWKELQ